ncbi:MAG: hypothetical protein WAX80_01300 [Minisyncoccia bacterium]
MHKRNGILIPLIAIGVVLFIGFEGFGWKDSFQIKEIESITDSFTMSLTTPDPAKDVPWTVFQNYLEFAKNHNLAGIKSLSHQISPTCTDPAREVECFALMDNVYTLGSYFPQSDFKHVLEDERQVVMYTDGPAVAILYFTKDSGGTPKVLGMRFCFEDETSRGTCVETDPSKLDLDQNGWWDSVESMFYK